MLWLKSAQFMLVQRFMLGHFCVGRGTLSWEVLPSHPPKKGVIRDHGYSLMKLSGVMASGFLTEVSGMILLCNEDLQHINNMRTIKGKCYKIVPMT